jgi:hypothetical protein
MAIASGEYDDVVFDSADEYGETVQWQVWCIRGFFTEEELIDDKLLTPTIINEWEAAKAEGRKLKCPIQLAHEWLEAFIENKN